MTRLFDLLYDDAWHRPDLTRWLLCGDDVQDYHRCIKEAEQREQNIRALLGQPGKAVLLDYINSVDVQREFEREMLFCQGLAMGMELGQAARR